MNLWAVFLTGLFAGGASCAAVQGGLLAGAVARRAPASAGARSAASRKAKVVAGRDNASQDALPVTGFLGGKLVSHVLLGGMLGFLGDAVQLGFGVRALMQITAGVLMVVMALDLLGVRAVRRLVPSMPAGLARVVRRTGRGGTAFAPALLGFATVLIPCGVTLSVGLLAVSSGSAAAGGLIMGTFVLGTSPLFAAIGYTVRRSAGALRGRVGKIAAVVVIGLGLFAIDGGLVLTGSPVSFAAARRALSPGASPEASAQEALGPPAPAADGVQRLRIEALNDDYRPSLVRATAGVPTRLTVVTNKTMGCTRAFVVPSLRIQQILPATGETEIDLGTLHKGRLGFTCAMGMYEGVIQAT